jgi:hypothetical protein
MHELRALYDLGSDKIGDGFTGSVFQARCLCTGGMRAVKVAEKEKMDKAGGCASQEVEILSVVDHPNIVRLFDKFEDPERVYLVMELCAGGELYDRIAEAETFTEPQAAIVMWQILGAVCHMHDRKVCHRDLKPENFLFAIQEPLERSPLKLVDFGLSCRCEEGEVLTATTGTPYYVAPQVLGGRYDKLADVWSCGVILYIMLCGTPPFEGDSDMEVLKKVRVGHWTFEAPEWKTVSEHAKQLVRALMKLNPRDRFTAEKAFAHEWVAAHSAAVPTPTWPGAAERGAATVLPTSPRERCRICANTGIDVNGNPCVCRYGLAAAGGASPEELIKKSPRGDPRSAAARGVARALPGRPSVIAGAGGRGAVGGKFARQNSRPNLGKVGRNKMGCHSSSSPPSEAGAAGL